MTHAEFRAAHPAPAALEPCYCEGEVTAIRALKAGANIDPVDNHEVELWTCDTCGHTIPLDVTAGRIRNDYPDPRQMIAALAESMRVKRS